MKSVLIYCYDSYCGWCYGFSPVMLQLANKYKSVCDIEVLSGGMILPEKPVHISATAGYIEKAYKAVEERTGIRFGKEYLWHIFNPQESDWFPNSEKPAIALSILKEYFPELQVQMAADLQKALHYEGRDLVDNEAYRHILDHYEIPEKEFYEKLNSAVYKERAQYEFALVKQLKVTGYPAVLLQENESKFYLLSRGYTDLEIMEQRIDKVLKEIGINS